MWGAGDGKREEVYIRQGYVRTHVCQSYVGSLIVDGHAYLGSHEVTTAPPWDNSVSRETEPLSGAIVVAT